MSNFLGNILNIARRTLVGEDSLHSAGQFQTIEIPANELRSDGVYVRSLEQQLVQASADCVYILHHARTGKYHVVVHFQRGVVSKVFSVYRDADAASAIDVANRFRRVGDLLILAETEETLKQMADSVHSHPSWGSVHVAAFVGVLKYFTNLRGSANATKLITSPCPATGLLPLHIAVDNNQIDVVAALLALHADVKAVDHNGMNAFHYAATTNAKMVEVLSRHEQSASAVNSANGAGRTPLFIAVISGKPDCVTALVKAGSLCTMKCEGKTVLEAALKSSSPKKAECVEALATEFSSLIIEPDVNGATPLHNCNDSKSLKIMARAVGGNSAYFNIRDALGETPLHAAVRRADLSAVVILIANDANVDAKNVNGQTPLQLSLELVQQAGQLQILKALLAFDASSSIPNSKGFLPRHVVGKLDSSLRDEIKRIFEIAFAERCPVEQTGCTDFCRHSTRPGRSISSSETSGLLDMRQEYCIQKMKMNKENGQSKLVNLLALDGGGVRGVVLIQILLALQKYCKSRNLLEKFQWVAATSTGSVVAAAFCQGKSLRDIQKLYFRLKDVVFEGATRPYSSTILERFLKEEIGEAVRMADIVTPKLLITTARADVNPIKLVLIRNYRLPLSPQENEALGYGDPKTWPLWKAVRCSTAAPTYFNSVDNRYVDGGLMANNPTLDLLTEVSNYEFAASISQNNAKEKEVQIGCVVSIGCGEAPPIPVLCSVDVGRPTGLVDGLGAIFAVKNLGEILINQVTATGGTSVNRSRAWCHSINVPFYRFSPTLFKDIPLDATDDSLLIQLLWCTMEYLYENRHDLQTLADLLS